MSLFMLISTAGMIEPLFKVISPKQQCDEARTRIKVSLLVVRALAPGELYHVVV